MPTCAPWTFSSTSKTNLVSGLLLWAYIQAHSIFIFSHQDHSFLRWCVLSHILIQYSGFSPFAGTEVGTPGVPA